MASPTTDVKEIIKRAKEFSQVVENGISSKDLNRTVGLESYSEDRENPAKTVRKIDAKITKRDNSYTGLLQKGDVANPLYTKEELSLLKTEDSKVFMEPASNDYYDALAAGVNDKNGNVRFPPSIPLQNIIKAKPFIDDAITAGNEDSGGQSHYTPFPGGQHKYATGLVLVTDSCHGNCSYCFRADLVSSDYEKEGGQIEEKHVAKVKDAVKYFTKYNLAAKDNGGKHPKTGGGVVKDFLHSGGDSTMLSNKKLAKWMSAMAETPGVETIRLGTKGLSYSPYRFDDKFFDMLDKFNKQYPDVNILISTHFTHPDEFLMRDKNGDYITNDSGKGLKFLPAVKKVLDEFGTRKFVQLQNQTPVIKGINDDSEALYILQRELPKKCVKNHYFFVPRDIKNFEQLAVPIEKLWDIVRKSKINLSNTSVLSKSTPQGKMEVVSVSGEPESGFIIFKVIRSPGDAETKGDIIIAKRDPTALWIDDYVNKGLIVHDENGVLGDKKELNLKEMPYTLKIHLKDNNQSVGYEKGTSTTGDNLTYR